MPPPIEEPRPTHPGIDPAGLPDYGGGGIVNLMATLARARGGEPPAPELYPELACPALDDAGAARNLLLLVVDGLGARLLERLGPGSALASHVVGELSSVFPPTTAAAVPTFLTGLAPRQHGLTGWHVSFAEHDAVLAVLPLTARWLASKRPSVPATFTASSILVAPPLFARLPVESHVIAPRAIVDSPFNRWHCRGARRHGFDGANQLVETIAGVVRAEPRTRKYIYAYHSELDAIAHSRGIGSPQVQAAFDRLDRGFARLLVALSRSGTTVVVTADHGLIDVSAGQTIALADHPPLQRALRLPLCGERRFAYCYLRPGEEEAFVAHAEARLGERATVIPRRALLEGGWLGRGPAHPQLAGRVGDVALAMAPGYAIKDWVAGERRHVLIGNHGGCTAAEQRVPLIVA